MKSLEFSREGAHLFLVAKGSWGNLKVENRIPVPCCGNVDPTVSKMYRMLSNRLLVRFRRHKFKLKELL